MKRIDRLRHLPAMGILSLASLFFGCGSGVADQGAAEDGTGGDSYDGGSTGSGGAGVGGTRAAGGSTGKGGSATGGSSGTGGKATGGSSGTGGAATGGSSGTGGSPPIVVGACDALPAAHTFQNVTPSGVGTSNFTFAIDPVNAGTVYLGTSQKGVFKSTDCASTWTHIDTGKNGAAMDSGMNWTFVVDPTDPKILYSNAGYGSGTNGAYKSKNGGVDWDPVWPPPDGTLGNVVQYNFANVFAMDPADHMHLLLTFHATCSAPYAESCIAETKDGGATWRLANGTNGMVGTEGQVIYFLDTPHTWIWGSQSSGFYRTEDSGATWTQLSSVLKEAHPQGSEIYRAKNGTFYLATADGIAKSADGKAWSLISGTGPLAGGIVGDGTTMYMSNFFYWNWATNAHPYWSAPEATGTPWTEIPGSPDMTAGGSLALDVPHRVLYASDLGAGFWRVVVP
jgi:hypothetical protein